MISRSQIRRCLLLSSVLGILQNMQVSASHFTSTRYNTQSDPDWPTTGQWLKLSRQLSLYAELYGPFESSDYEELCYVDNEHMTNPFDIASKGEGICMQYSDCANSFCLGELGKKRDNLPAYVLMAKEEKDIVTGVQFATKHNIKVSVKSTGHSLSGASTAKDTLLIWLAQYPEDNTIQLDYQDSCGDTESHNVIGVAAGQNFKSIAEAVGDDYHFVSASEWTVSASGGFIQGGGVSFTSRHYGLGVDNVVDFRVVLPSSAVVIADRCTNSDLFWALRGGGGGSFGIVTHMNYKLHAPTPIVRFSFNLEESSSNDTTVSTFLKYVAENLPNLDSRWGGRFSWFGLDMYFAGFPRGAQVTFLDDFIEFAMTNLDLPLSFWEKNHTRSYDSWSKVLPELEETTGQAYVAETSFSRLVPHDFATGQTVEHYQLLESLAKSNTLGYTNVLLGQNINKIAESETSVHPAFRESAFLLTANQIGYEKLLEKLPNNVTGASKNHVGSLEPNWRESIWGEHYERLLEIKELVDPRNIFSCYQCVGYEGEETDMFTKDKVVNPPNQAPTGGTIDPPTSAAQILSTGSKLLITMIGFSMYLMS